MIDRESDRHVSRLLDELGPADPPDGFASNVMARILSEHGTATKQTVPFTRDKERVAVTRKAMWGLAAAASITLAVFVVRGFPPSGPGSDAAIGAAQTYQAPQFANASVPPRDAAVQEFLQSDTFERLLGDPDVRSLLTDAPVQSALQDAELRRALADPDIRAAIVRADLHAVFARADLREAISSAEAALRNAVEDASLRAVLADPSLRKAINNAAVRNALSHDDVRASLGRINVAAALNNGAFLDAMQHDAFGAAIRNGQLQSRLSAN